MDWEPILIVLFIAILAEILMPLRILDFRVREDSDDENPWSQTGYLWPPSDYSLLFRYRPWQLVLQIVLYAWIGLLTAQQENPIVIVMLFLLAACLSLWRVWQNTRSESG